MKPKIFLSHNKNDKDFIKQLADALRPARIDVWYDDWEIPPGASLRTKIFEEGIPACDLFFVYLTENSINSNWVKQELDAAFVTELEDKGGFLALYVNKDEIRDQLTLDLRSRRIPAINQDHFSESLLELVSLAWETFSKKQVNKVQDKTRIGMLELEKKVLEKELEIEKLKSETRDDYSAIIQTLSEKNFGSDEGKLSLKEIFFNLGINLFALGNSVRNSGGISIGKNFSISRLDFFELASTFLIMGLIERDPTMKTDFLFLTDLGRRVVLELGKQVTNYEVHQFDSDFG